MTPTNQPMNETRVEEIRKAWATETPRPTHYEHCYRAHAHCAIFVLLEEIERLRARIAEVEETLSDVKQSLADRDTQVRRGRVECHADHAFIESVRDSCDGISSAALARAGEQDAGKEKA